jgi:hypothetical protein
MNRSGIRLRQVWLSIWLSILFGCNLPTSNPMTPAPFYPTPTFMPSPSPWPAISLPTQTLQPLQPLQSQPVNTTVPMVQTAATPLPIVCNRAEFVGDVSVPDGTQLSPGASFTKTWRFRNAGSCTWTPGYVLLFDHGDSLNAPSGQSVLQGTVPPGALVDVSVQLSAPSTPGAYQAFFRMRSPENIVFGIGSSGLDPFWVKIVVPQAGAQAPGAAASGAAGNSNAPSFKKLIHFGGGGSHGFSCSYPGSQPAIQVSQDRNTLTICVFWGTSNTPFSLQFKPPGGAPIQPINFLVATPTLDGMPRMRWDGYGDEAFFDVLSKGVAPPPIYQVEATATPTNDGTGIILLPPGGVLTLPTTSGLQILPTATPTPTSGPLILQTVYTMEILAWIPNYLPGGEWRVQTGGGFTAETPFHMQTNGSLPRIAAINPGYGSEFTPIPVNKAYLEFRLLKRKQNGGINLVGTSFPASVPVYVLLYHETSPDTYSLEVQQTVQADTSGSVYTDLAGPLVVGDSYLAVAVTDPNSQITDSSGHIDPTTAHDFFKVVGQ